MAEVLKEAEKSAPRVVLMGAAIGIGNRGVSALGASLVRLICAVRPDAQVTLLIGSDQDRPIQLRVDGQVREVKVVNYRLSPRAPLSKQLWWIVLGSVLYRWLPSSRLRLALARRIPWVRAAATAELAGDIRGGDSFSDLYGLRRFVLGALAVLSVVWVRGRVVLFPQTYGPYRSWLARRIARHVLMRADIVLSRDATGLKVVRELTGGRREARFCPDVAFALEPRIPEQSRIEPPLPERTGRVLVGLNVNGLMYNGGYTRDNMFGLKVDYRAFLAEFLREMLERPEVELLLVPHTYAAPGRIESDNEACRLLAAESPDNLRSRVHRVTAEYDQHEIKGVIGQCDFFVGSRMHACIAALSQGIPTVGMAYSRKFVGVFDCVGAGEWVIDGRETDTAAAMRRVVELYQGRESLRKGLLPRVTQAQAQLRSVFAGL